MKRGNSVVLYGFTVFFGRIALITLPIILWILDSQFSHVIITVSLCQYACSCNGLVSAVTFDNGCIR